MSISGLAVESTRNVPCGHERENDEGGAQRRVVMVPCLGRLPLGKAEDLHEQDPEEQEERDPERKQAQDNGQARPVGGRHTRPSA